MGPTGGITSPYELTIAMAENAADNGGWNFFEHRVESIERKENDKFRIITSRRDFVASCVINAAGVNGDVISKMAGDDSFIIHPRKGEYCLYDRKWGNMVSRTVFQPPSNMGKGVLVTPTVDGNLLIGPNAVDTEKEEMMIALLLKVWFLYIQQSIGVGPFFAWRWCYNGICRFESNSR